MTKFLQKEEAIAANIKRWTTVLSVVSCIGFKNRISCLFPTCVLLIFQFPSTSWFAFLSYSIVFQNDYFLFAMFLLFAFAFPIVAFKEVRTFF